MEGAAGERPAAVEFVHYLFAVVGVTTVLVLSERSEHRDVLEAVKAGATGYIDLEDDKGALWKYIPGRGARENLLMSPGDTGEQIAGHPFDRNFPRNCSYSFNARIMRVASSRSPGFP